MLNETRQTAQDYLDGLWREHPLYPGWERRLQELTGPAWDLLQMLAFLPHERDIPAKILEESSVLLPGAASNGFVNPTTQRQTLAELRRQCLIDGAGDTIRMNPAVQDIVRVHMTAVSGCREFVEAAYEFMQHHARMFAESRFQSILECGKFLYLLGHGGGDVLEAGHSETACPLSLQPEFATWIRRINEAYSPPESSSRILNDRVRLKWADSLNTDPASASHIAMLLYLAPRLRRREVLERNRMSGVDWEKLACSCSALFHAEGGLIKIDEQYAAIIRETLAADQTQAVESALLCAGAEAVRERSLFMSGRQAKWSLAYTLHHAGLYFYRMRDLMRAEKLLHEATDELDSQAPQIHDYYQPLLEVLCLQGSEHVAHDLFISLERKPADAETAWLQWKKTNIA